MSKGWGDICPSKSFHDHPKTPFTRNDSDCKRYIFYRPGSRHTTTLRRTRHTPPRTRHTKPPPFRRRACWEIQSTSVRYASYWKAILFKNEILENPLRLTCDKHQRKVSLSLLHSLCVNGPLPVLPCRVLWWGGRPTPRMPASLPPTCRGRCSSGNTGGWSGWRPLDTAAAQLQKRHRITVLYNKIIAHWSI